MNYFLSIVILISGICLGQNKYYVLPEDQTFNLYEKQEDELVKLEELKFKYTELYAFDSDEFVIVNDDSTKFHYGRIKNSKFEEEVVREFQEKFRINTIELKDGFVYLGGSWSEGELFYVFDLKSKEFYPVPIPDEAYQIGKAIDDILFLKDKMIAVDNIMFPKFLIEYSLNELPELKNSNVIQLQANGTYEHYYKGNINENYLVLLSDTHSGYTGTSYHISVLKSFDYNQGFTVASKLKGRGNKYNSWNDILLLDEKIYVACKEDGVGVLNIKENYFGKTKHPNRDDIWFHNKLNQKAINYMDVQNGIPIKLLPFNSDTIIVILQNTKGQKSFELIKI